MKNLKDDGAKSTSKADFSNLEDTKVFCSSEHTSVLVKHRAKMSGASSGHESEKDVMEKAEREIRKVVT
jgi:hypothetical protein